MKYSIATTPSNQNSNANLIPTFLGEINGEQQPLVDARKLHEFLEVGKDYTTWIKQRIEEYGFIEGLEYSPILGKTSRLFGGRPKTDYHISLDMAKELSMVERNEKGRQARRYFIDCEKKIFVADGIAQAFILELDNNLKICMKFNQKLSQLVLRQDNDLQTIKVMYEGGLTNEQMARAINASYSTVEKRLRTLRDIGLIGERGENSPITKPVGSQLCLEV